MRKTISKTLFLNKDFITSFDEVSVLDDISLILTVIDNNQYVDLSKQTIELWGLKPDKTVVQQLTDIVVDGNNIIIKLKNSFFTLAGCVNMQLKLTDEDGAITTFSFKFDVKKTIEDSEYTTSTNEIAKITQLTDEVQSMIDLAYDENAILNLQEQITSNDKDIIAINERFDYAESMLPNLIIAPTGGDDTKMIQQAVDTGRNVLSLEKTTYIITQPIRVNNSNQIIDFNYSTIEFTQDQTTPHTSDNASRTNNVGIFDLKNYDELFTKTIETINLENGIFTLSSSDVSDFVVDDFVRLNIQCGEYSNTSLNPKINVLAKIIKIDGNDIHLDYSCSSWDVSETTVKEITRVIPQKNITIKNITINDNTPIRNNFVTSGDVVYPAKDSHYACCGIGISHGVNIKIENIVHTNGMFSTIHSMNCYNCEFTNIITERPRLLGGGEGYCIQNINFHNIQINNIKGYFTRHTLDFSCGGYAIVNNVKSMQSTTSDIQLHGQYEHDIEINNLHGIGGLLKYPYFNAGSGTAFGNASANITFINSDVTLIASKDIEYIRRLSFDNCNVVLHRATNDVYFTNCNIQFKEFIDKPMLYRGGVTSKFCILNCTIEVMDSVEKIAHYDQVEINGGKIINNLTGYADVILEFIDCLEVNFSMVNKIDCGIKITNDSSLYGDRLYKTNILGCNFYCYRYAGIWLNDVVANRHMTVISNNNFVKSSTTTFDTVYCIDLDGEYKKSSNVKLIVMGNNSTSAINNLNLMKNNSNAIYKCINNNGIDDIS